MHMTFINIYDTYMHHIIHHTHNIFIRNMHTYIFVRNTSSHIWFRPRFPILFYESAFLNLENSFSYSLTLFINVLPARDKPTFFFPNLLMALLI